MQPQLVGRLKLPHELPGLYFFAMNRITLTLAALVAAFCLLMGCTNADSEPIANKSDLKGGTPPSDVWDKVGEAKANQPDRSKDYGTIPGETTKAPPGAPVQGPK